MLAICLPLAGCPKPKDQGDVGLLSQSSSSPEGHGPYRSFYDEAHRQFKSVLLFKPRDDSADGREFDLAPLIVQEVISGTEELSRTPRFGALEEGEEGRVDVNADTPTLYVENGRVQIRGATYETLTFHWFYSMSRLSRRYIEAKALRIVLDRNGFPIAYDMAYIPPDVKAAGGPRTVYVSKSFELAARGEFGDPLPGRRFSAEKSLKDAPQSVLVRVVEDGPIPMGPYVYVEALTKRVNTLLCRCSPSQIDEVLESPYYDLVPFDRVRDLARRISRSMMPPIDDLEARLSEPLDDALRWPKNLDGGR